MKKAIALGSIAAFAILAAAPRARAESWIDFEAGIGASYATALPGVWQQAGMADDHEKLLTPAYLGGFTGEAFNAGSWSLNWHADYVYLGSQSASCECVSDAAYAAHDYSASANKFSGSGHVQGIAFTVEPGYSWGGTRLSIEGGPFLFWTTWNEDTQGMHIHAYGGGTLGYVLGARVEHGHFGLSYRLYENSPQWRAYPGLIRQESVLMANYKF